VNQKWRQIGAAPATAIKIDSAAPATHGVDFILHRRVFIMRAFAAAADCWENITCKSVRRCSVCHQVRAHPPELHIGGGVRYTPGSSRRMSSHILCTQPQTERNFFVFCCSRAQLWPAFWSEKPQQTHIIFGDA
jgi:hypothetical protein